jgi:tetraacyldisaccharide 4'-kinase
VRPLRLPPGAQVIGVGGATLGGAGKTPLVLALARAFPNAMVVASGYRARGPAHAVKCCESANRVGDEALWLARELSPGRVFVGPRREQALALAARRGSVVIADALLQARPARVHTALLVVDGARPFGAERCPPAGDLRARRQRLLDATDAVVVVGEPSASIPPWLPTFRARAVLDGARCSGGPGWSVAELRGLRLGLALAIARPERVLASLRAVGIEPVALSLSADHGRPRAVPAAVDGWLTTAKCATKLGHTLGGAPVWPLLHRLVPEPGLLSWLRLRLGPMPVLAQPADDHSARLSS